MEKYPILANAPIHEALIDIQVKPSKGINFKDINLYDKIKDKYPIENILKTVKGEFPIDPESGKPEFINIDRGFRYSSKDGFDIFQSRIDGFTLSRLKPYKTWEVLKEEGLRLWKLYREVVDPTVVRIALRYINKIVLPLPIDDFGEYFMKPPEIPDNLPQGLSSYLNRLVIHDSIIGANAIITNSMEPITNLDNISIIFDIYVYKKKQEGFEEEEIWETLDNIRDFKNNIFYNSITDKLLEILK